MNFLPTYPWNSLRVPRQDGGVSDQWQLADAGLSLQQSLGCASRGEEQGSAAAGS